MLSICPSCKNQIEHEDFLFEVVCDKCRTRFNPFMQQMDAPAEAIPGLTPAGAEPSQMGGGSAGGLGELGGLGTPEPPAAIDNFAESNQVFQELQQFGETLQETPLASPPAGKATAKPAAAKGTAPGGATMVAVATECAMTTGEMLQGHTIVNYLEPVSVWADLDASSENPMKPAFDAVANAAKNRGGNGLIGLKWALSADGSKVLVSGVAVQVNKA